MQEPICNQTKIPREQWRYGLLSSAKGGCGWIAAYNVMVLTGRHVDIPDLIQKFLLHYPVLNGVAGTAPDAPARILRGFGYRTHSTVDPKQFDELGKAADAGIFYYFWREGFRIGVHFAAVQYRGGEFWGYNFFRNVDTPYRIGKSLSDFIRRQGFFCVIFTGIWKRQLPNQEG